MCFRWVGFALFALLATESAGCASGTRLDASSAVELRKQTRLQGREIVHLIAKKQADHLQARFSKEVSHTIRPDDLVKTLERVGGVGETVAEGVTCAGLEKGSYFLEFRSDRDPKTMWLTHVAFDGNKKVSGFLVRKVHQEHAGDSARANGDR